MITLSQSGIVKLIDRLSLHTSSISLILKNPSYALKDPNWRNAMYNKCNSLVKNGNWLLVLRPASVNMVRSMWLLKHKFHADGTLSRYKARLRSLCGLKQAPYAWFQHFVGYATRAGFYHSRCDSSLYIFRQGSRVAYLVIYVDDIILTASCPTLLQHIIGSLNNEFDMTDLEGLNYFVSIFANRTPTSLFLSPKKYALHLFEHADMVTCNPSQTPVDTESKLGSEVQQICLYMHDPREPHLPSLKRILKYVQGTLDLGLHIYASSTTSLVGYSDADWTGSLSTRISTSVSKAEYRGVANVVAKTAWLCNLLCGLHSPLLTATLVY
nr:hypothetical protein [Tanacetum cinerariifolium]